MKIKRRRNGNVVIVLGIGETVTVRGESIHVSLDEADNMAMLPKVASDVDELTVTGRRRSAANYPPDVLPEHI